MVSFIPVPGTRASDKKLMRRSLYVSSGLMEVQNCSSAVHELLPEMASEIGGARDTQRDSAVVALQNKSDQVSLCLTSSPLSISLSLSSFFS